MRAPIIRVSAVALIALFSLTLTSCTAHTGGGSAQNSPAASASGNGAQGSAWEVFGVQAEARRHPQCRGRLEQGIFLGVYLCDVVI